MGIIWIALAGFCGAITLSMLGWLNSGEAFEPRKFIGSLLTAVITAITIATTVGYTEDATLIEIFMAFLMGAGADASRKAVSDAIRNKGGHNV